MILVKKLKIRSSIFTILPFGSFRKSIKRLICAPFEFRMQRNVPIKELKGL